MKKYSTLLESLPAKTVVFAFGRFNPPTTGHELLVRLVKKLAQSNGADHAIYASATQDKKKNPLSVDRKIHYLNMMFSGTHFYPAGGDQRTFIEVAKHLNKNYKNLIMVAGSDRVPEYQKLLDKYNGTEFHFDSIKVMSAGERDPDADDASGMSASKMRAAASKGDFTTFKKGLPSTVRDIDAKRLMNEIRTGMGMDAIKEQVKFELNSLREAYLRKEIFNIGDIIESNGAEYEIVDRGTNYLTVVDGTGNTYRKWLHECTVIGVAEDIQPGYAPKEISFKGYTTKNLHHSGDAAKAFQGTIERYGKTEPATVLAALKATDAYMKLNDMHLEQGKAPDEQELQVWRDAHTKARDSLNRIGEFLHHQDYWHNHEHEIQDMENNYTPATAGSDMADSYKPAGDQLDEELTDKTIKSSDKIKVARVIADMLGVENAETMSPDAAVNAGLRKIKNKRMTPELIGVVKKMLQLASEVGIKVDKSLVPQPVAEDVVNKDSTFNIAKDVMRYKDFTKLAALNKGIVPPEEKDPTEVGHSLHTDDDDHVRRMKVRYKTESIEEQSVDYDTGKAVDKMARATKKAQMILRHAKERQALAARQHGQKKMLASEEQEDVVEDVASADYKISPTTGRKYRAHQIKFANSGMKDKLQPDAVSEQVEDDMSEDDLESMVQSINSPEDVLDVYDDEELVIADTDTGEVVDHMKEEVAQLNEVLSRIERMRAKIRFARTQAKRERRLQIALKQRSSPAKINTRARRLAVNMMKQRIMRKPASELSVQEKERVEAMLQKRKALIGRLAMKLAPRIRKIESERLSHSKVTQ